MVNETLTIRGDLVVSLNGEQVLEKKNLIVNAGKNFLASAVINTSSSPFSYMAIGTGTTAAAVGDTALGSEVARSVFTSSSIASNVVTLSTTYAAGTGTGALTEAGILNASSGGTLLSRVVFSAINKGASDSLTIVWTITVG